MPRVGVGVLFALCAAAVGVWLASYWRSPVLRWRAGGSGVHLAVRGGTLWITRGGPPDALAGARPIVLVKGFASVERRTDQVQRLYLGHDGDETQKHGRVASGRTLTRWQS